MACSTGTTASFYGVPMFSAANLVVGDSGLVLRSSDFGAHWFRQAAPTAAKLHAVEFSVNNTSHIYAVGDSGTILKTTDEGTHWLRQNSGTARNLNGLFLYLDDWNGFVCGDSGTILRTRDGGAVPSGVNGRASLAPLEYAFGAYPNPFNPTTTISFSLKEAGEVRVAVYDVSGRLVRDIVHQAMNAGEHRVAFEARDLPTGVYLARLECAGFTRTEKVVLLK